MKKILIIIPIFFLSSWLSKEPELYLGTGEIYWVKNKTINQTSLVVRAIRAKDRIEANYLFKKCMDKLCKELKGHYTQKDSVYVVWHVAPEMIISKYNIK